MNYHSNFMQPLSMMYSWLIVPKGEIIIPKGNDSWCRPVTSSSAEYESLEDQRKIKEAVHISAAPSQPSLTRERGDVWGCTKVSSSCDVWCGRVWGIRVGSALSGQRERLLSLRRAETLWIIQMGIKTGRSHFGGTCISVWCCTYLWQG